MISHHQLRFCSARDLSFIPEQSIDLVVTSPPYPMIEMWDEFFASQAEEDSSSGPAAGPPSFEAAHGYLDGVWAQLYRVLRPGGISCINIGDATRSLDGSFQLYTNHARVLSGCLALGFQALPEILWRKQTNAPNKFMGSGMLPAGAYITLEHEYILILRKGERRQFTTPAEKLNRARSAFFWEERNSWFSDLWDLKGTKQNLKNDQTRARSAAFPFELAYRLINMFSVKGDTVLDPFLGTGTTMLAAMTAGRNSVGVEIDRELRETIRAYVDRILPLANARIQERLQGHLEFMRDLERSGRRIKYRNHHYGFPVMTRQELEIMVNFLRAVEPQGELDYRAEYLEQARLEAPGHQLSLDL